MAPVCVVEALSARPQAHTHPPFLPPLSQDEKNKPGLVLALVALAVALVAGVAVKEHRKKAAA